MDFPTPWSIASLPLYNTVCSPLVWFETGMMNKCFKQFKTCTCTLQEQQKHGN